MYSFDDLPVIVIHGGLTLQNGNKRLVQTKVVVTVVNFNIQTTIKIADGRDGPGKEIILLGTSCLPPS